MSDPYDAFPSLTFEHPEPGILEIVLDAPGLNAVGHRAHSDLVEVWLAVDKDPDTRVALIRGAGDRGRRLHGEARPRASVRRDRRGRRDRRRPGG